MVNVTVYSTQTCPYCAMVKQYLDRKGVQYNDVDVSYDRAAAQEMVMKSGQMGVPVVDINGSIVVGFNTMAIDSALGGDHAIRK